MKVNILVRKEWVNKPDGYEPQSECQMFILGVFEDLKAAKVEAKNKFKEFYDFQRNNYVIFGDKENLDGLFEFDEEHLKVIDHTEDTDTEIRWEVLEWMTGDNGGYEIKIWTPDMDVIK